jgi:hypothetical protein
MSRPLVTFEDNNEYRIMATASCGHKGDRYLMKEPTSKEIELIAKEISNNKCNICQKKDSSVFNDSYPEKIFKCCICGKSIKVRTWLYGAAWYCKKCSQKKDK